MHVLISAIGKIHNQDPEQQIISEYRKRFSWKLQISELVDKKSLDGITRQQQESRLILQTVPKNYFLIALDENGQNLNSEEFAKYLSSLQVLGKSCLAFTIGGAYGHSKELLIKADYKLALGKMTMSHKLVRVVLVEQLYRAHSIISGHPYHHK